MKLAMDAELKERWATALESGTYEQGQCQLRTPEGTFCCLGVLCDLINPNGWTLTDVFTEDLLEIPVWTYTHDDGTTESSDVEVPSDLAEQLGLNVVMIGELDHGCVTPQSRFTYANDDEGKSFTEIAGLVRELL